MKVTSKTYKAVFNDGAGKAVFDDLMRRFYDCGSYTQGDAGHTAYKEGMRYVAGYINLMTNSKNTEE